MSCLSKKIFGRASSLEGGARFLLSVIVCAAMHGCSMVKKVQHLPELLTLKNYADSQDEIAKNAAEQNQMFEEMVAAIDAGQFDYSTRDAVMTRFGQPTFRREMEYQGQVCDQWVYRHVRDFRGDKVYLYFDGQGQLMAMEYIKQ